MLEKAETPSVTEQIVSFAPNMCTGCEDVFVKSCVLARKVIDSALTLVEAQEELQADLIANCRGRISRHGSWGELKYACTYKVPLVRRGSNHSP